jgi:hypothetical protein
LSFTHLYEYSQTQNISMDDILKFEQAVAYMNQEYPFSENFGKVSSRDELIIAAESIYRRLLMLVPGSRLLPFYALEAVTAGDDGSEDQEKKTLLKYLFRADARGDITIIAFVQSCDFVYRQLRYFRASVGNAKVIDKQAEIIINAAFRFLLFLFIISMLKFNPWTLLVSMSTLLVTASFAVGPSCAKAIEVRRYGCCYFPLLCYLTSNFDFLGCVLCQRCSIRQGILLIVGRR